MLLFYNQWKIVIKKQTFKKIIVQRYVFIIDFANKNQDDFKNEIAYDLQEIK